MFLNWNKELYLKWGGDNLPHSICSHVVGRHTSFRSAIMRLEYLLQMLSTLGFIILCTF